MTQPYHLGWLLAFDTETTGPDPETARVVSATLVRDIPDQGLRQVRNWLVDPGVDIPEEATAVHGITTQHARENGRRARIALAEIARELDWAMGCGVPVVAFNAAYDFTVMARELHRHGLDPLAHTAPVVDPHVIDKAVDQYRPGKRTLGATAQHYGVELLDAHTSEADAVAALGIARTLPEREASLAVDAGTLHRWQVTWRARQCAGLTEYKRREDPEFPDINPGWPIQSEPARTTGE